MSANFYQAFLRMTETVQLAEDQRLSLSSTAAAGFLGQEATILSDAVPFDAFDAQAYSTSELVTRSLFSQALSSFGGELAACLVELAKVTSPTGSTSGVPQTDPTQILPILYKFMAQGAGSTFSSAPLVNSRNLTYSTPTYGASNVGTGVLYRLTVDAYGFPLEGGFAETLNAICAADAQSGTIVGQEQFSIYGQPSRDALTWFTSGYGSGITLQGSNGWVGVTSDTTQPLIQNSSFSQATGTSFASSFALTGWTLTSGSASSMGLDTTNYYRAAQIEGTTPASLELTGSVTITQLLSSNAGALAFTAFLNQIAWDGQIGTWVGSFTIQIGSKSWSVSSGATGWNTLRPTINKNLWFQNFDTASLAVTITITVTSGALRIDDFCWSAMQAVDGTLWWLIGGQTAFLVNDTIQAVTTEPSPPSKLQNWIRLMFPGYYLPSAVLPATPATACVAAVSATGGATTSGAHVVWISVVNATAESALGPASNIIVVDGTKKIDLSSIPTGAGGTTKRRAYLSKHNDVGPAAIPYFCVDVAGNVATTATIDAADAALTLIPGSVGDPTS